jgi:hypothetical protein
MPDTILASAEDCRPLFDLMNRIHDLAPWDWMEEVDLFGVQDPDSGEVGFVSIMGMAGEHYAIGVYRGARGLYGFWHMQEIGPFMQPQDLLNTPQLQASYEDRDMLEKRDHQLIKSLGLKYRGRNAWPMFRSYRPGYAPWHIEPAEARFLALVLEQVLEVTPRVKQQPAILEAEGETDYLVRVAQKEGVGLVWRDEIMTIEPPGPLELTIEIDPQLIDSVRRLPRGKFKVEADFFMLPGMVGDRNERPYFPYMLMMLDTTHDLIISAELLSPVPSLEQMWGQVGVAALRELVKVGSIPAEIRVRENLLYGMLMPFAQELGLKIKQVSRLPLLDRARREMERYMRRW